MSISGGQHKKRTNIDNYSKIGKNHKNNEDYVVHNNHRLVLTDGCSSANFSHIGSRILAHCTLNDPSLNWLSIIQHADDIRLMMNLPIECLAATLIVIDDEPNDFVVHIIGDGTVIRREIYKGGTEPVFEEFSIEYTSGAPFYLSYLNPLAPDYKNNYMKEFGAEVRESWVEGKNFSISLYNLFDVWPNGVIKKTFPKNTFDLVAVFSDGLHSFKESSNIDFPAKRVLKELLSFKGYAGEFVQRRCRKAFSKFDTEVIYNMDDFSMGVMVSSLNG